MYREISKLIMYQDVKQERILYKMGEVFHWKKKKKSSKQELIKKIYIQLRRLLDIATDYGFNYNLWHNYLTFYLVTNENPYSLTCEKVGAHEGSANYFAKNDFRVFKNLFDFDFLPIEK